MEDAYVISIRRNGEEVARSKYFGSMEEAESWAEKALCCRGMSLELVVCGYVVDWDHCSRYKEEDLETIREF